MEAAQASLVTFYRMTNRAYSVGGYTSAWVMREEVGNSQSAWLDMTLQLARGQLQGGWRNMNWIPGKGWQQQCNSRPSSAAAHFWRPRRQPPPHRLWTPDLKSAAPLAPELERMPRKPAAPPDDGVVNRISDESGLPDSARYTTG